MSKFKLFARSSIAALAANAGLADLGAEGGRPNDDLDPEAGPKPEDPEEGEEGVDAEGKPMKKDKPACEGDAAAAAAAAAGVEAAAEVPVVALADAQAVAGEQFQAGMKAERERTTAVLSSDDGKANPTMAAWMLSSSPNATAESIITQLAAMPSAYKTAQARVIPDTNVDLGRGAAADVLGSGADGDNVWATVQGSKVAATAPVVPSDRGSHAAAALASGASFVMTGAAQPKTPAVAPTGN